MMTHTGEKHFLSLHLDGGYNITIYNINYTHRMHLNVFFYLQLKSDTKNQISMYQFNKDY